MISLNEELRANISMYIYIVPAYIVLYQSTVFIPRKDTVPTLFLP